MNIRKFLEEKTRKHLEKLGVENPPLIKTASRPEHGHYQANGIMAAAKEKGVNPRELAQEVVSSIETEENSDSFNLEIAGPGFINITISTAWINQILGIISKDVRLGVNTQTRKKFLTDYSSPNLAKEMHIGHLRSTTIGDACSRILEFLGHQVIRTNHVGDWGSQFGSLLAYMNKLSKEEIALTSELKDLESFYRKASQLWREDQEFADEARKFVVKLQSNDPECLELWSKFIEESMKHCQAVYDQLNISLKQEHVVAESFYNEKLESIVKNLTEKKLITISDGAKCIFLEDWVGKDGEPTPAIIQKSDGGFPYITTDLAAARHRSQELNIDEVLYFVDARQTLHFRQLFHIALKAGFTREDQNFRHIPNGIILSKEGKPYKTRQGGAVKLAAVLKESISRAKSLVSDKNSALSEQEQIVIAEIVGIGAIKYAELSKNRNTDYVFDWEKMLSFEGNTAPYLQYAYTRIKGILNKSKRSNEKLSSDFALQDPYEIQLALKLAQFTEAVESVVEDYQPNLLCNYLFELSQFFMTFYENCPVNTAEERIKISRLNLCDLTGRVLKKGLELLGIEVLDRM